MNPGCFKSRSKQEITTIDHDYCHYCHAMYEQLCVLIILDDFLRDRGGNMNENKN